MKEIKKNKINTSENLWNHKKKYESKLNTPLFLQEETNFAQFKLRCLDKNPTRNLTTSMNDDNNN